MGDYFEAGQPIVIPQEPIPPSAALGTRTTAYAVTPADQAALNRLTPLHALRGYKQGAGLSPEQLEDGLSGRIHF